MPVSKRTYASGKTVWFFSFDAPGSTRNKRERITDSGYATKREAEAAEAKRRIEEQQKYEASLAGAKILRGAPSTLGGLLQEFILQYAEEKLAPKTIERYRQQAAYLAPELLSKTLSEITPLMLSREWSRLLKSGGHTRRTKAARPLSSKTVRNISGVVSSAFVRAVRWGLAERNPVSDSEPPVPKKHKGMALTTGQQDLLIKAATGPWCLSAFLELAAALGARRGEVLALRWSDIVDGRAIISRSLTQTKQVLAFKSTKTDNIRVVGLPESAIAILQEHRNRQEEFRREFGPDYRADLDLIFANPDGSPMKPDSISSSVSQLCRRLKLPKGASLHTLRHTHGSHLLANGVPLPVVSARLGHSSVRVTADVYGVNPKSETAS